MINGIKLATADKKMVPADNKLIHRQRNISNNCTNTKNYRLIILKIVKFFQDKVHLFQSHFVSETILRQLKITKKITSRLRTSHFKY